MKTRPQCPNCNSFKSVSASTRGRAFSGGIALIILGSALTFFIITAIIGVPLFLLGILVCISAAFLPEHGERACRNCGNHFTASA